MKKKAKALPPTMTNIPFTFLKAKKQGLDQRDVEKLVKQGVLEKLAKGVYRKAQDDISEEDLLRAAALRAGDKSVVCLISALVFHGLTDLIPKQTWLLVPVERRTRYSDLRFVRVRHPHWDIGIQEESGFRITTIERTVIETIHYHRIVGKNVGTEALRRAIDSKKTTLGKILDVARTLKLVHRVRPYIEALS